jgi:hypothetical protein
MAIRGSFPVDEVPSPSWDLALDVIRSGAPMVVVEREVPVSVQRHHGWPNADGRVHVCMYTRTEPSRLTPAAAAEDGQDAVRLLGDLIAQDPRLGVLLDEFGWRGIVN